MRAFRLERFDGPDGLRLVEEAVRPVQAGNVLVEVRSIGINYPDLLTTRGQLQELPELPSVIGREFAGVVAETSPTAGSWAVGDEVCGYVDSGAHAELVQAPSDRLMHLPPGASFAVGAALVVNYQTAYFALADRGRLMADELVLVLGAAGGVGTAAVQVARARGARVIGGVADEDQVAMAMAAGAHSTVILTDGFHHAVHRQAPSGVDVVVDPLGGPLTAAAARCLGPEGRLLVVGYAAGDVPKIATNRFLMNNTTLMGVAWTGPMRNSSTIQAAGVELATLFQSGDLRPQLGATYSFEQLPAALKDLAGGRIRGKATVDLSA